MKLSLLRRCLRDAYQWLLHYLRECADPRTHLGKNATPDEISEYCKQMETTRKNPMT